jgi:6-phosphogluconolactonase
MSGASDKAAKASAVFHAHADVEAWIAAAVTDIAAGLRAGLRAGGIAHFLVSGGSTPAPVYRALARQALDWSRVAVALVDERWLPPGDADSNAVLVGETLLIERAASARFEAMLQSGRSLEDSVRAANRSFAPAAVTVLGMGPDGHTASLFPYMPGLRAALASADPYVAVDADGCPGAGSWRQRISLTPAGLARSARRILLIRGEHKRIVLEQAMAGAAVEELPVAVALTLPAPSLHVHWCP